MCTHIHMYTYIYIYIYRERERERKYITYMYYMLSVCAAGRRGPRVRDPGAESLRPFSYLKDSGSFNRESGRI